MPNDASQLQISISLKSNLCHCAACDTGKDIHDFPEGPNGQIGVSNHRRDRCQYNDVIKAGGLKAAILLDNLPLSWG